MEHETIRGRLVYTSKKPAIMDKVRGGEVFAITKHVDGRRTLRAQCAIFEKSPKVLRDTTTSLDADWQPTEAFVQITVDEQFVGSSWYRFTDREIECEGLTKTEGRISSRMPRNGKVGFFVNHSLIADAMHLVAFDLKKGPGTQIIKNGLTVSLHHRGATGPGLIALPDGYSFTLLEEEKITVGAGTFDAYKWRYGISDVTDDADHGAALHPPYYIWTTTDGDYIMLKAGVTGYMQTYYELVELQRGKGLL